MNLLACTLDHCEHRTTRVTARDAHLDQIVTASRLRLRAAQQAKEAERLRNDAMIRLVKEDGLNARQAAEAIHARLLAAGFTDGQIADLGVSAWNIRRILPAPGAGG